jgi:flagellar biosynthetic protein FliP
VLTSLVACEAAAMSAVKAQATRQGILSPLFPLPRGEEDRIRELTPRKRTRFAFIALAALLVLAPSAFAQTTLTESAARTTANGVDQSVTASASLGAPAAESIPAPAEPPSAEAPEAHPLDVDRMLSPQGMSGTMKVMALLTVLSLAPSILIMTTCFIRFIVVLGLLRQALGTQQLPPNQVLVSLCLFLTFLVMAPVWKQSYDAGIRPYAAPAPGESQLSMEDAFTRTAGPLRRFMADQIEATGNSDAVWLFLEYQQPSTAASTARPETYDDVPLSVLLPAYMLSELKTAFVIGFQIYLPFLVIDLVVSTILISMGMMMLPPVLVSLPFKLLLFVLIDGWFLTVGMLLESVRPLG